jgi:Family of unknown function (DUF5994)
MTSDPNTRSVTSPDADDDRIQLKQAGPRTGRVDGGWWPRSLDLLGELPALAEVLSDRIGTVSRVAYALDGWQPAPRRGRLGERIVRLEGFRSQDTRILHVTGANGTRLSLRLVPPDTAREAARTALRLAANPVPHQADPAASRWENDGGS